MTWPCVGDYNDWACCARLARPVAEVREVMTGRSTTSLAGAAAPVRDVMVATKFHVPRAGLVPRPRLLARLAEGVDRGLTVVSTPAGFGKTTMLGDWARRSRGRAAWLSLDAADNDPARFWRCVAAALERSRPGISGRIGPLLGPALQSFEGVVA